MTFILPRYNFNSARSARGRQQCSVVHWRWARALFIDTPSEDQIIASRERIPLDITMRTIAPARKPLSLEWKPRQAELPIGAVSQDGNQQSRSGPM